MCTLYNYAEDIHVYIVCVYNNIIIYVCVHCVIIHSCIYFIYVVGTLSQHPLTITVLVSDEVTCTCTCVHSSGHPPSCDIR